MRPKLAGVYLRHGAAVPVGSGEVLRLCGQRCAGRGRTRTRWPCIAQRAHLLGIQAGTGESNLYEKVLGRCTSVVSPLLNALLADRFGDGVSPSLTAKRGGFRS